MEKVPSSETRDIYDIETLSPQSKMRYILETFDSGKGTTEEKEERKRKFIELIGNYNQASIKSITHSDSHKKTLHNEIMAVMRSISLSKDVSKSHREIAEYLVHHRKEVERMVTSYFLGYDTAPNPDTVSPIKQARENPLYFSKPGEDD